MRAPQPGQSALLLRDVVDVLTAQGVDDAVLGAMAMSVHGVVRASLDANAVTLTCLPRGCRRRGFRPTSDAATRRTPLQVFWRSKTSMAIGSICGSGSLDCGVRPLTGHGA